MNIFYRTFYNFVFQFPTNLGICGRTEVAQLAFDTKRVHQYVRRLDVSMDDAVAVELVNSVYDLKVQQTFFNVSTYCD